MAGASDVQVVPEPPDDAEQVPAFGLRQVEVLDPHPSPAGDAGPHLTGGPAGVTPRHPRGAARQWPFASATIAARDRPERRRNPAGGDDVEVIPDPLQAHPAEQSGDAFAVSAVVGAAVVVGSVQCADRAAGHLAPSERRAVVERVPLVVDGEPLAHDVDRDLGRVALIVLGDEPALLCCERPLGLDPRMTVAADDYAGRLLMHAWISGSTHTSGSAMVDVGRNVCQPPCAPLAESARPEQ